MTDFILTKRKDFTFALEDKQEHPYTLPTVQNLSFEDAQALTKIDDEQDIIKKGELVKNFIIMNVPELKDIQLGDMVFFEIFNAYSQFIGKSQLGESKASRN